MKQFNNLYKSIVAIVLLLCSVHSFAQSPIAFGSPWVRNWRAYKEFPIPTNSNGGFANPGALATIGNKIYSFTRSYYISNQYVNESYTTEFNPKTNTWTEKLAAPNNMYSDNVNFVIDNKYYYGLGVNYNNGNPTYADASINVFDADANTWSTVTAYPDSNLMNAFSVTLNNKGYVIGGEKSINGTISFNSLTKNYDPATNSWSSNDNLPRDFFKGYDWKCFTANNKAYIFSTRNYINELWEFDPNAAIGSQWTQKANPNLPNILRYFATYNNVNGFVIVGGAYDYEYNDGSTSYTEERLSDSIYSYNTTTDTWTAAKSKNKFYNYTYSTTVNNELFYFSNNINDGGLELGYGNEFGGYYYVDNSFLSTPLDTVNVHHNFTSVCGSTTPTVSYSVANHLNHDNQFVILLTRSDGYVIDTLAVVNDSISGSTQVTMPSSASITAKIGDGFTDLRLAVTTTSPRTIFNNQGKSFSMVDDPAALQVWARPIGESYCPGMPIQLNAVLYQINPYTILNPTTVNWGTVYGGTAPTDSTINILSSDSFSNNLTAFPITATKTFFCYNVDTTFTYTSNYGSVSRYSSNPILNYKFNVKEGNSICITGNETKHIYAEFANFYGTLKDTIDIAYTYYKNGAAFKAGHFIKENNVIVFDTIVLTNVDANDEFKCKLVFQANGCDATAIDSSTTTLIFKSYNNALSNAKTLQYNFNNNLIDSSVNNNNGVGENIAFTSNRFGQPNKALRIFRDSTGANVSQVVSDTTVGITGNAARTISFWFKTDSVGYHYTSSNGGTYSYPHRPAVLGWGKFELNNYSYSTSSFIHIAPDTKAVVFRGHNNDVYSNSNVFKFGEWTHVAFVYDGLNFNLYVNGKCEGHSYDYFSSIEASSGTTGYNQTLATEDSHFRIGNDGNGIDFNNDWRAPFDGSVDDILIYDKAMTSCQIDSLYRITETTCTLTTHTINAAICQGSSYHFNNRNLTTAGTYKDTLVNVNGCDSVVTLNLSIKQKSYTTIDTSRCVAIVFKGNVITSSGTYTDTKTNAVGCDSVITWHITILKTSTSDTYDTACTSYTWNGTTYTQSGSFDKYFTNAAGCDSVATIHLIIKQKSGSNITANICTGNSYNFYGTMVNGTNTFTHTLTNAAGCDSIITLYLYQSDATNSAPDVVYKCTNELPYMWNGSAYNTYQLHSKHFTNSHGCDSIAYLDLRKPAPVTSTTTTAVCSNQLPYMFNGVGYNVSGTYASSTLQTAQGCDSIATLILIVNQTTSSSTLVNVCSNNLPYLWNGTNYTASGSYSKSFTNSKGCDSTATLFLTVKQTSSKTINDTILSGTSYSFNGNNYTITGIYVAHLTNAVGCDSTVTLNLFVKAGSLATITGNLVGCSFTVTNALYASAGGGAWKSSNTNVATINQFGVVTNISNGTTKITYTINKSGVAYVSSADYTVDILATPNAIAGPNTVCVDETILLTNTTANGTWSSLVGRANVNANGVVTGTSAGTAVIQYKLTSSTGCSTFVTKDVIVKAIPAVPTIAYATNTPLTGSNSIFKGAPSGGYCVGKTFTVVGTPSTPGFGTWTASGVASITTIGQVTVNAAGAGSIKYTYTNAVGCSSSRTLSAVGYTCAARGISTEQFVINKDFTIYPNPARSVVSLNIDKLIGAGSVVITDLYGKQVKTLALSMGTNIINISSLAKGMYLVSVITNEGKNTKKLVVE